MKKRVLAVMTAIMMAGGIMAGCSSVDNAPPAESIADGDTVEQDAKTQENSDSVEFVIGFDMSTDKSEYCLKFGQYIEELAKEAGMTPLVTQSDADPLKQIQNAENWITKDAQVLAGIWCDRDATRPVLDMCMERGLPLVSTLTSIEGGGDYDKYIYLGSENYEGGYLQGEYLSTVVDKAADNHIYYIAGPAGDQQSADRRQGFYDALDEYGVNYTEVATLNVDGNTDDGVQSVEDWVQAYGELQIVAGFNDSVILGGITAYESAGQNVSETIWLGFDGSDGALESIAAGKMTMTVFQDAYAQAKVFVDLCKQIRDGADVAAIEDINVPFKTVTADNIEEFTTK